MGKIEKAWEEVVGEKGSLQSLVLETGVVAVMDNGIVMARVGGDVWLREDWGESEKSAEGWGGGVCGYDGTT